MLEPMSTAAVPPIYQDPVQYELLAQMTAPDDLAFYRSHLEARGGPVLELGVGTGRVAVPLARAGAQVTGLDYSAPLLAYAAQRAESDSTTLELVEGDMREFDLGRTFSSVLLPYNTLNHLVSPEDWTRAFTCIRRHMSPKSLLIIDTLHPSLDFLANKNGKRIKVLEYLDPHQGKRTVLFEQNDYDPVTQVNRITWYYTAGTRVNARVDGVSMRLFFPAELDTLLAQSGFRVVDKLGGYAEQRFCATSPKQVLLCELSGT